MKRFAIVLVIAAIGLVLVGSIPFYREKTTAQLFFRVGFPDVIDPLKSYEVSVQVRNQGGDADNVEPILTSDSVVILGTKSTTVREGEEVTMKIVINGRKDLQYGGKTAEVKLRYKDGSGDHETASTQVSFYLLPAVELFEVGWKPEGLQIFGKGTIGKTDKTELHFRVHSRGEQVIYAGLSAKIQCSTSVPGLSLSPTSMLIERIGPDGRTGQYSVSITSSSSPPGKYMIDIVLVTPEGYVITKQSAELTISG